MATIEHVSLASLAAAFVDSVIESVAHRRGAHVLELDQLPDNVRDAVRANLNLKMGGDRILSTDVNGKEMRLSISTDAARMRYEIEEIVAVPEFPPPRMFSATS